MRERSVAADTFPYSFSNFIWWSDPDLRVLLKQRVTGLGDMIARDSSQETKIRLVLAELIRAKGIHADVQSFEPSLDSQAGARDPDANPASIVFTIASPPEITIGKVTLEDPPHIASGSLNDIARGLEGKPYDSNGLWFQRKQMKDCLQQAGYLTAAIEFQPGPPVGNGDHYLVPLLAHVVSGTQYHVSNVSADGGPLLQGRDLSPYFALKPGDVASPSAFGRLTGQLRSVYWHAGYSDVEFQGEPVLDVGHALASYHLTVVPGAVYRLRGLKIENLDPTQQDQVRGVLGLKTGDIYDELAVANLSRAIRSSLPLLKGYGVSYTPREDKVAHVVDLTLSFYKESNSY
jgi:outer membrane protein assembly factor BamA